jgi:predicted PurR-regulated permease PerM
VAARDHQADWATKAQRGLKPLRGSKRGRIYSHDPMRQNFSMNSHNSINLPGLEDKTFLFLVVAVSLAFAWILWPYFGAILWATVLAIVFAPAFRRLSRSMRGKRTLAALIMLVIIVMIVILPVTLITALLLQEGFSVYERIQSGEFNIGQYFKQIFDTLPAWVTDLLDRFELTNLGLMQERLSGGLVKTSQFFANQALKIGQNTFDFIVDLCIVLYLLFFLLRDGDGLTRSIKDAIPLYPNQQRDLFNKFTAVIRSTIKGTVVVAIVQGALGGLILWALGVHAPLLWAALMAVLSLLPAVGSALVWLPVAIYFLVTGAIWRGIVLIAFGVLVIGLVDNLLRPVLVGKETKIPDYVVLVMASWDIFSASRSEARLDGES